MITRTTTRITTRMTRTCHAVLAAGALGACLLSPALYAATGSAAGSSTDIEAQYKNDVARCNSGQTNQDRATCLREAGAARDEARHQRLLDPKAEATIDQNALQRCNALPADQRQDCMTQMSGHNTNVQGSVGAGGLLRETTITVPGPEPSTNPPAPASGVLTSPPAAAPATPAPVTPAPGTTVR